MKKLKGLAAVLLISLVAFTGCGGGASKDNAATAETTENTATAETTENTAATESAAVMEMTGETLDKIQEDNKEKEKYLVIDVRPVEEYDAGHVKHAINIPFDQIEGRLAEIEGYKDKDVVTICNSGNKSGEVAETLVANGFTKVYNAEGVKKFSYTTITPIKTVLGPEFAALAKTGEYTIVDVREDKDYNEGHLEGAIHTTVETADEDIKSFPTDKPFMTYCYSGNRSWQVADKLSKAGYMVVNAFDGAKEYDGYEFVK